MKHMSNNDTLFSFDYTTVYEAERFTNQSNCTLSTDYYPFTGDGCVLFSKKDAWVEWDHIEAKTSGNYTLILRYSNNAKDRVHAELSVNGTFTRELSLVPTQVTFPTKEETWEYNWKVVRASVFLNEGANTLRLKLLSEASFVYIDNLAVSDGAISTLAEPIFNARDFGAKGDGITKDTQALQAAIDACAGTGGSVYLDQGTFLSGTVRLKSNMTLFIEEGAMLLGTIDKADYPAIVPANDAYIQEFIPGFKQLVYAEGVQNVTLTGGGILDVQGDNACWTGHEYERPIVLCLVSSQNMKVTNIDIQHAACWTFVTLEVDHLIIDGINIHTTNHINRDGIDPVDSHHVLITNSAIIAGDDAICPKSGTCKGVDHLHVKNVAMNSGGANGIKFGSSSYAKFTNSTFEDIVMTHINLAGISLGVSDGADLDNLQFKNIRMNHPRVPLSILNGGGIRGRRQNGAPMKAGKVQNLFFKNITARNVIEPLGSHIDGLLKDGVTHYVENILLENVDFHYPGDFKDEIPHEPPEYNGEYPDYYWCDPFMPAYGMYVRHVRNITFLNCKFTNEQIDLRKALLFADVEGILEE